MTEMIAATLDGLRQLEVVATGDITLVQGMLAALSERE
jgi:hypothetical protein